MKYLLLLLGLILYPYFSFSVVAFEQIKDRTLVQFELVDIIIDLSYDDNIPLLEKWQDLSPQSFQKVNIAEAYLCAADKMIKQKKTNQSIIAYIKAYQTMDKEWSLKVESAYKAALYLYAQHKRPEALFYINRAIEGLMVLKTHELEEAVFYLKRRIVWRYLSRLESLPDNAISVVEFDGDDVWIGMWSGAVARYSRSLSQLDLFNVRNSNLPSHYVRDILVLKGKVWVATHEGLAYYQKSNSSWNNIPYFKDMKLKTVSTDGTDIYITALFRGVFRSKDGGITWNNIVPKESVLDVLHLDDKLYLATPEKGVFLYQNNKLQRFLPNVSAKTIIQDTNPNFLWIGTYGQGLFKVHIKTGKIIEEYNHEDLQSNYIESLLLVNNQLWVGTLETGVSIYDISSKKWEYFGLREGLPGLDITTITQENNHLWFGTLAGGLGIYMLQ